MKLIVNVLDCSSLKDKVSSRVPQDSMYSIALQCMGKGEDKMRSCWYNSLEDQNYANNWQMLRSPRLSLHTVTPDTKSLKHFLAKTSYCKTLYTTRFTYLKVSTYLYLPVSPFFVVDISTVHLLKWSVSPSSSSPSLAYCN